MAGDWIDVILHNHVLVAVMFTGSYWLIQLREQTEERIRHCKRAAVVALPRCSGFDTKRKFRLRQRFEKVDLRTEIVVFRHSEIKIVRDADIEKSGDDPL